MEEECARERSEHYTRGQAEHVCGLTHGGDGEAEQCAARRIVHFTGFPMQYRNFWVRRKICPSAIAGDESV